MKSFAKPLEDSSRAGEEAGPNAAIPASGEHIHKPCGQGHLGSDNHQINFFKLSHVQDFLVALRRDVPAVLYGCRTGISRERRESNQL